MYREQRGLLETAKAVGGRGSSVGTNWKDLSWNKLERCGSSLEKTCFYLGAGAVWPLDGRTATGEGGL